MRKSVHAPFKPTSAASVYSFSLSALSKSRARHLTGTQRDLEAVHIECIVIEQIEQKKPG